LEKYIYKKATLILGQSEEIIHHIKNIIPEKKCFLYRNFPDHNVSEIELNSEENKPIKIFYAGLLGIAQGVLELCQKIDLKGLNIELHIFGDGAEKNQLEQFISSQNEQKIFFHGMMERKALHETLKSFDIAIVPLKTRIYGSVPSKIFEYTTLGFPILYFGGGEGGTIVKENGLGWVAEVENFEELNEKIIEVSKLSTEEITFLKYNVFKTSKDAFNLDFQIEELIKRDVF
jgi:glycosyltransferase involved in cell wall biosynthesis